MAAVLTERTLHDRFFQDREHTRIATSESGSDSTVSSPQKKERSRGKELLYRPVDQAKSFGTHVYSNVKFFHSILFPLIGHSLARRWREHSFRRTIKRLFPGVQVFRCLFKAARVKCGLSQPPRPQAEDAYPTPELVGKSWLNDLFVGFSVGAMSVPQGMSYAMLAGLGLQYGLYNNIIFPMVYFLFGSCRHAVTGVSAIENLMTGETLTDLLGEEASPEERHNAAVLVCLCMGVIFLVFRILKLAVIADLLADPVLSGFATASAFLVGTSQLKHAFGMKEIKSDWGVPESWGYILRHLPLIEGGPVLCCFLSLVFLILCKSITRRFKFKFPIPGPLLLVIFTCLISWGVDIKGKYDISIVGEIPSGLPSFYWPSMSWNGVHASVTSPAFSSILLHSLKLAVLFFIIHISIAKTIAMRQNYEMDAPQELVAFAGMNAVGGFFQCYPANTSLSRSSVTESLGAKTPLHSLAAGLVVLCTVLFLTRPLSYLPMPSLAAVVLFGVSNMAEFDELARLWRLQKGSWASLHGNGGGASSPDFLLWIVSFLFTLLLDATIGILVSVAVSLLWIGKSIVRPEFIQLGNIPGTSIWRNCKRFPDAETREDILIYRFDAPLNFSNSKYLERCVIKIISESFPNRTVMPVPTISVTASDESVTFDPVALMPPYFLILDCSSVNGLDISAISSLRRITKAAGVRDVTIAFSNWKGPQRDFLAQADFYDVVPPQCCFLSNADAVTWAVLTKQRQMDIAAEASPSVLLEADGVLAQKHAFKKTGHTGLSDLNPEKSMQVREVLGTSSRVWDVDVGGTRPPQEPTTASQE